MRAFQIIIIALVSMVASCGYPLHPSLRHDSFVSPPLLVTPVTTPIEVKYRQVSGLVKSYSVLQRADERPDEITTNTHVNIEEKGDDLSFVWTISVPGNNRPVAVINQVTTHLGKLISSSSSYPAFEGMKGKKIDEFKKLADKSVQLIPEISNSQFRTGDVWAEANLSELLNDMYRNLNSAGYKIEGQCMQGFKIKSIFEGLAQYKNNAAIVLRGDDSCRVNIISLDGSKIIPSIIWVEGFSIIDRNTLIPFFKQALFTHRLTDTDENVVSYYERNESN